MSAIKNAFQALGQGIEHAVQGLGEVAKGVLTLDFDEVGKGVEDMGKGALEAGRGAMDLTPVGLAANTLMDGALDKGLKEADKVVENVADKVVDGVANDLDTVKNGVEEVGEGLLTGNLGEIGKGLLDTTVGAVSVADDFTPEGLAMNTAMAAGSSLFEAVSEKSSQKVSQDKKAKETFSPPTNNTAYARAA